MSANHMTSGLCAVARHKEACQHVLHTVESDQPQVSQNVMRSQNTHDAALAEDLACILPLYIQAKHTRQRMQQLCSM